MHKIVVTTLTAAFLVFAGVSQAVKIRKPTTEAATDGAKRNPVCLKDAAPILGKWTLVEVAPRATGQRIPENRTWEFRPDGTLVTSGYNRHFKRNDTQTFHYEIDNCMIVSDVPGRPGKKLRYRVYDLQDDRMVLQGGVEGFYFFKRQ